jgi:soluble lytic murein transglycosylase
LSRVFRSFFIVLGIFASLTTIAQAEENADPGAVAAITAGRMGDWPQAYAKAGQVTDGGLALKIVRWLDYSRPTSGGRFAELAAFIDQNPDWPLHKKLLRRAEEALTGENDDVASDWLKRHPPIGGVGKARAAQILLNRGNTEAGTAAMRAAWIDGDFNAADERAFLVRHGGMLRHEDHEKRLDRLIWDGLTDAARHMLPLVPADYRLAAEARLALAADATNGEALLAKVPAQWRSDPGVAFEEARWRRKKNQYDAAAQLLLAHAESPMRPSAWWGERQLVARQLLATGNPETAYKLAQQHGLTDGSSYSEAEFLTGYIALRYHKDPALALDHFTRIMARAATPYGKARAAYWSGRAAEAAGDKETAAKWYTAGAEHMATFYGQLAAHQLGKDAPPRPVPEPQPNAVEQKHFDNEELVRAAKLLQFRRANGRCRQDPGRFCDACLAHRGTGTHRSGDLGREALDRGRDAPDGAWLPGHAVAERGHRRTFALIRHRAAGERLRDRGDEPGGGPRPHAIDARHRRRARQQIAAALFGRPPDR